LQGWGCVAERGLALAVVRSSCMKYECYCRTSNGTACGFIFSATIEKRVGGRSVFCIVRRGEKYGNTF